MKTAKIIIIILAVILFIGIAFASFGFHRYANSPLNPAAGTTVINIPRGASFVDIAELLEREGILHHRRVFSLIARILEFHRDLKAGEYEISGSATPLEMLEQLKKGVVKGYLVTVPEGFSIEQAADCFAAQGLADREIFISLVEDRDFLSSLGIEAKSAEGYLFPDTYRVTRSNDEAAIIRLMVQRFRQALPTDLKVKTERLEYSLHEIITIASLIEKEATMDEEKPLISAVFHNRLKRGMRLQSDPTVVYQAEDFSGRIRKKDLLRKTPYNTYLISGLPPGPICNPGAASIKAALNPASVDYLYFVAKNDGTHHFSSNLFDHNKAVIKYQIKRKK
ncbi:MAG TPA: endolytic transglycosylase MltG [Deltaproteobacteria bacterium]|nr:endolytic transglycosylase MltG [Deltaproteobacteria bacterium]